MKKFGVSLLCAMFSILLTALTASAQGPVPLGTAASFAALAGSTITNTGSSVLTGDLGLSPGTSVTGFPPGILNGTSHITDGIAVQAQVDLTAAYLNAAGRTATGAVSGDLGGLTLTPGVYKADTSIALTGTLTLNAAGNPNAVFIFQIGSTLTTASASSVLLINQAQACNVFWQVGSSATLGTASSFKGNILALTSITATTGALVDGRLLARNGALTLDTNALTKLDCAAPPPAVADLTISKSHSGNFTQGQVGATFTLTASNVGLGPTSGTVTVSDTLPAGLAATAIGGTGWTCTLSTRTCTRSDALAAGASYAAITITVNVTSDAPATVINTAAVSGGGEVNAANNSASDTATVTAQNSDLTITKSHSGTFVQGQVGATYTLTASNIGPAPTAGTVTVIDTLPAGLTATAIVGTGWSCTLPTRTCTRSDALAAGAIYPPITVTVNVAGDAPATVINTTTVSGGGEVNTGNNSASDTAPITQFPDLIISKSHSGTFVQGQVGAAFTLTASNIGSVPTTGTVSVSDALPPGLTATAIVGTGWSCTLSTRTCTRSDALAAGASYAPITVTVNVAVDAPAIVINAATVSGGGEVNTSNNSASDRAPITQFPDITISKSHSGNFIQGQVGAFYTLTASNIGRSPTVGTVTVIDTLPAGLSAAAISGTGWTCTNNRVSLSCTRSDALAAGASYSPITVTVNVSSDAAASLTNTATVSGGGELILSNNSASDTATITKIDTHAPDLTIIKSHSGNFQQGGTGSYTLTVKNIGPVPTNGTVTVSDTLPAGLTAAAISGTGWTCTLSTLTCTRNDALAAGTNYPPVTVTVNVASDSLICSQTGDGLTFQPGDILISMHDGTVQWRRHDWTLVKIITGSTDGQAKGMAFDTSGNLFVTHYFGTVSGNDVEKFDRNGNLVGLFGSGYDCNPSSIVFDYNGNAFIGQSDCSGDIFKVDSGGNRLAQYNVAVENRGSGRILLDPNQCTMYYTSQGTNVKRYNICTDAQMSDFNRAPLPDVVDGAHQLARLPGGGLLVANFGVIARLDDSGNLVRTYDAPAESHCWYGLALDPDGTSFWTTNWCASSVTRFDMLTGNVIESHVVSDLGFMAKQIIVVPPLPGLCSTVVINTAAVSGGGEEDVSNNSASDSTTIVNQPPTPLLSVDSTAYCVGTAWSLSAKNAAPNASIRLIGTTNGQPWVIPQWATTDANGNFTQGGTFAQGTEGSYIMSVEINGKLSNVISLVVSTCRQ